MAGGKWTQKEIEEEDMTVLTRDEAIELIVDDLWQEYTNEFPDFERVRELIMEGFKGVAKWSDKEIENWFECSVDEILEWQVID